MQVGAGVAFVAVIMDMARLLQARPASVNRLSAKNRGVIYLQVLARI
jgi:hypothetical protein